MIIKGFVMTTYKELLEKKAALDAEIEAARRAEMGAAIERVRALVAEFQMAERDIFGGSRSSGAASSQKIRKTVAAKYRNPATGETWTGRGKAPKWIDGQERNQYLIVA